MSLSQNDLKIIVIGPSLSGKTELVDLISGARETFSGQTSPTIGLRIQEFQSTVNVSELQRVVTVFLWDTSGNEKYSSCWPAIAKDADGALLVYNAFDKPQAQVLEKYARELCKDLADIQVLLVANKIGQSENKPVRGKVPKHLEKAKIVAIDIKESLETFNEQFTTFLGQCVLKKQKDQEAAERRLVGEPASAE